MGEQQEKPRAPRAESTGWMDVMGGRDITMSFGRGSHGGMWGRGGGSSVGGGGFAPLEGGLQRGLGRQRRHRWSRGRLRDGGRASLAAGRGCATPSSAGEMEERLRRRRAGRETAAVGRRRAGERGAAGDRVWHGGGWGIKPGLGWWEGAFVKMARSVFVK
jgi:hypothetical protein